MKKKKLGSKTQYAHVGDTFIMRSKGKKGKKLGPWMEHEVPYRAGSHKLLALSKHQGHVTPAMARHIAKMEKRIKRKKLMED